LLHVWGC